MQNKTAISIHNLRYAYAPGKEILRDISLEIAWGQKCGLIGPNGAGKSTLLCNINGVFHGTGQILVDSIPVGHKHMKQVRRRVGMVFQDPDDQLFCPTVYDDVAFGPLNMKLSPEEVQQSVDEALDIVGMQGYAERISYHLSYGEKQRIAIATVLAMKPTILLLDEPTNSLDPKNRRALIEWLKAWQGTLVIASHDLDMVLEVCERTILMNNGQIAASGETFTLLSDEKLLKQNDLELPLSLGCCKFKGHDHHHEHDHHH